MKKTSFLENIREKKADLSQSRISDTCIIIGSTFLRLLHYRSLLCIYFPRQMLQNCRNWKRKAAVVDNSRSSSKRETIISLSSSLFLDVVFFPCKMLRFFSAGVQRVKEIGFSALTFFSLLSFFSRGEKSVEVNFRKQLTSTARADNSLKIGCSSNSATVEAIPKLCTF